MTLLSTLSFTVAPQKNIDPKLIRRQRLIERLEQQKKLALDPTFVPVEKRWKKNPDGSKAIVDYFKQIKRWWEFDGNNKAVLTVKSGLRTLEFEKGKSGIVVGDPKQIPIVIDTLIAAVKAGELDKLLEASTGSAATTTAKPKKAA